MAYPMREDYFEEDERPVGNPYSFIPGYSLRRFKDDMPAYTLLACDRCHAFVDPDFYVDHDRWCL